jgi:hypothetical protein
MGISGLVTDCHLNRHADLARSATMTVVTSFKASRLSPAGDKGMRRSWVVLSFTARLACEAGTGDGGPKLPSQKKAAKDKDGGQRHRRRGGNDEEVAVTSDRNPARAFFCQLHVGASRQKSVGSQGPQQQIPYIVKATTPSPSC